ncbi:hypothetical protein L873DRAFT_1810599 [Choiromyces venosus 120613-1]|uniref:Aminoglycoside phosphotransferase domain-containing protein n=1 Tax=Choiromyces venosus 120613-1 TaxID=1336337 RepID=A0A3N4JJF7_9PEZI|nr:hypothetical protein L873DRAFT_1810599 [Choiromyces venosus 120613-1]
MTTISKQVSHPQSHIMPLAALDLVPTKRIPPVVHPLTLFPKARLIYHCDNGIRQIYDLGNGLLYKFRPHRLAVYESDIHALIKRTTTIPVPDIYYEWVTVEGGHGGDGCGTSGGSGVAEYVHHMVMEKIEGEPLTVAWKHLDKMGKENLVLQFTNCLNELRTITSPSIRSVNGGPLYDELGALFDRKNTSQGPFTDNESLWLAMTSHLRDNPSSGLQQILIELSLLMPQSFPAVLTHSDLHQGNILVRNGRMAAIIDWEGAGFFPSWMEYVQYHPIVDAPELEFEHMVVKSMQAYPIAREFMAVIDGLRALDAETA